MTLRRLVRWTAPALFLSLAAITASPAAPAEKWNISRNTPPETVEELKLLQDTVKQVVEKCSPCTVGLIIPDEKNPIRGAAGSGVIIDEDGLIMTVGHVSGKPGVECKVIFDDGKKVKTVKGKTLGYNKDRDTGMIKITEKGPDDGKWPYLKIGKSADLKVGQWVVTLGHPGGHRDGRPPVVRLGQIREVDLASHIIKTNCTLVGGDSGGPLFDLAGNVVGIHDRIGFTLDNNIHLPIESYQDQWDRLVKGEVITRRSTTAKNDGPPPVLGVTFDEAVVPGGVRLDELQEDGPAAKAGLKAGDVITEFDGEKVTTPDAIRAILKKKKAGDEVEVTIKRGNKTLVKTVTLGKRDS